MTIHTQNIMAGKFSVVVYSRHSYMHVQCYVASVFGEYRP